MKATLTKTAPVQNSRRQKPGRNIVYIESPFDTIADEFASKHNVWNLPFKSKTWSKICSEATKINAKALKEIFPEAVSIKFSAKAGCACGCSQGYIVKTNSTLLGQNHWVTIEASQVEQDVFRAGILSLRRAVDLQEEIAEHELVTVN
jgi:hypothetical protein